MTEYIKREAVKEAIEFVHLHCVAYGENKSLLDVINEVPAADVAPVRHGRWIENTDGIYCWFECSECGGAAPRDIDSEIVLSAYCPNCGAKMDLRVTDNG